MATLKEKVELVEQAIEAEEGRLFHIGEFLRNLPLDSDTNIAVSMELSFGAISIEEDLAELRGGLKELTKALKTSEKQKQRKKKKR